MASKNSRQLGGIQQVCRHLYGDLVLTPVDSNPESPDLRHLTPSFRALGGVSGIPNDASRAWKPRLLYIMFPERQTGCLSPTVWLSLAQPFPLSHVTTLPSLPRVAPLTPSPSLLEAAT